MARRTTESRVERAPVALDELLIAPHAYLAPRLLNKDSAGLVLERLDGAALRALGLWYVLPIGGNQGRAFLKDLPLLAGWIEAIEPDLSPNADGYGFTLGGISLAIGLVAGCSAIERLSAGGWPPERVELEHVLEVLREQGVRAEVLASVPLNVAAPMLYEVALDLATLSPGVAILLRAAFRLATQCSIGSLTPGLGLAWPRFHFYAGLVAAGVSLPAPTPVRWEPHAPESPDISQGVIGGGPCND